jgi:hypothetical protein
MHLVNIKRVAYGIKNCATLVQDDPTWTHAAELNAIGAGGAAPAPAAPAPAAAPQAPYIGYSPSCGGGCSGSALNVSKIENAPSPQDIQNGGATIPTPVQTAAPAPAASNDPGIDTQQLNAMIESMTRALKGE